MWFVYAKNLFKVLLHKEVGSELQLFTRISPQKSKTFHPERSLKMKEKVSASIALCVS